jgi:hypothetical protein
VSRAARAVALTALCAVLGTACGSEEQLPSIHVDAAQPGTTAREPGEIVLRFVQAARRGDAKQMWALLSEPTRRSIGPGVASFARGTAPDLIMSFEDFRDGRILLSRRLDDVWAVGAIAGRDEPEDGDPEPAAYAAALRREGATWRIELYGLVIARLRPEPLDTTGDRPEVRAEAQAGDDVERMLLWLDGDAARVPYAWTSAFTAEVRGRPSEPVREGEHALVVFAATRSTAAALAWSFEVDG